MARFDGACQYIAGVGLSRTQILDGLFANNHKSSAGMIKKQNQPTSAFLNVKFVALVYLCPPKSVTVVGMRGWFSMWAITVAAPASVHGVLGAVSLLHFCKRKSFSCGQRILALLAQRGKKKLKKNKGRILCLDEVLENLC